MEPVTQKRAELLLGYLREVRSLGPKFRPGRFDCALFAAEWAKRCTGRDLAAEWRGSYRRLQEGRDELRIAGFNDVADLAASHLQEIVGWERSRLGDIAAIEHEAETAFGVIGGPQIHVLSAVGLDYVHLDSAARVFRP